MYWLWQKKKKMPSDAKEIIKDPMVLEFLGLKRESAYYEKDLEGTTIISSNVGL